MADMKCLACGTTYEDAPALCRECGGDRFERISSATGAPPEDPGCRLHFPWGTQTLRQDESVHLGRDPDFSPLASDLEHHLDVSRRHAKLSYANGHLMIEEAGSRNGTYLNGERVEDDFPAFISSTTTVRFGKSLDVRVEITG